MAELQRHVHSEAWHAALATLPTMPLRGTAYRACDPAYANTRDLLTGEGARRCGGRWNPPLSFPVVYLAQSIEGAIAESLGVAARYGFDPAARLPLTIVAVDVMLERVLNLTDPHVCEALGVTLTMMSGCDWRRENHHGRESLTQALGRAAFDRGLEAIIVPSVANPESLNINVFPSQLAPQSSLTIKRADRLPPPFSAGAT